MNVNKREKKPRLLSVEDIQDTVEGICSELELFYGVDVHIAPNMEAALDKLEADVFDLILLDMKFTVDGEMQDDAGLQLMLRLRQGEFGDLNRKTRYILFTAQDFAVQQLSARFDHDEMAMVLEGRHGFYGKVMSPTQMAGIVAEVMGVRRVDLRATGGFI